MNMRFRDAEFAEVRAVKAELSRDLRRRAFDFSFGPRKVARPQRENVVGIATELKQGEKDGLCVKLYLGKQPSSTEIESLIFSPLLRGVPAEIEVIGQVSAQFDGSCHPELEGGISVGHPQGLTGTLGCLVKRVGNASQTFALSNNHVLANANHAADGDFILQPGAQDGGTHGQPHPGTCGSDDLCIGPLVQRVPIDPDGDNEVDAALADVAWRPWTSAIRLVGVPSGVGVAQMGGIVAKVGRTSDLTRGTIVATDADIAVRFVGSHGGTSFAFRAWFVNQIAVRGDSGSFTSDGDSGSIYLDDEKSVVGLHFAAGEHGKSFANHIQKVFQSLDVELA